MLGGQMDEDLAWMACHNIFVSRLNAVEEGGLLNYLRPSFCPFGSNNLTLKGYGLSWPIFWPCCNHKRCPSTTSFEARGHLELRVRIFLVCSSEICLTFGPKICNSKLIGSSQHDNECKKNGEFQDKCMGGLISSAPLIRIDGDTTHSFTSSIRLLSFSRLTPSRAVVQSNNLRWLVTEE